MKTSRRDILAWESGCYQLYILEFTTAQCQNVVKDGRVVDILLNYILLQDISASRIDITVPDRLRHTAQCVRESSDATEEVERVHHQCA
jgi:hypothetical protein